MGAGDRPLLCQRVDRRLRQPQRRERAMSNLHGAVNHRPLVKPVAGEIRRPILRRIQQLQRPAQPVPCRPPSGSVSPSGAGEGEALRKSAAPHPGRMPLLQQGNTVGIVGEKEILHRMRLPVVPPAPRPHSELPRRLEMPLRPLPPNRLGQRFQIPCRDWIHARPTEANNRPKSKISLVTTSPTGVGSSPTPKGAWLTIAGWRSQVSRQAHNLKIVGSNPAPATNENPLRCKA